MKEGRKGIESAIEMVHKIVDRFVQISKLMNKWSDAITHTRKEIYATSALFDEETKTSVRKAIDNIVNSFDQMYKGTRVAVEDIVKIVPELKEISDSGKKKIANSVKTSETINTEVQTKAFKEIEETPD